MPSEFTWLDHSESDRREMQQIVGLFQTPDTRDELGIGQIRDIFADLLFPGTSTIQTRARYFLFVPWIFMELERQKTQSRRARRKGREMEIALIQALENGGERDGVIGIRARGGLKRLPSSIYWHGLGVLGIRLHHQSVEEYYRSLDSFYRMSRTARTSEATELYERAPRNWHGDLPEPPHDLFSTASLQLTREEASYIKDRFRMRIGNSMFTHLVDEGLQTQERFPWEYPKAGDLPSHIREWLLHAQNFSEAIHGAALLYNLMLAEAAGSENLTTTYGYALEEWSSAITVEQSRFTGWDRTRFWAITSTSKPPVRPPTRTFIDRWLDIALKRPEQIHRDEVARNLIQYRETALKKSQARLTNLRALERWSGAAGTAQVNYRWPIAQRMTRDIVSALDRSADA